MFLVGDIGGTNARLAIARTTDNQDIVISDFEKFPVGQFGRLEETINHFVDKIGHRPSLAVLAVAGPINQDEVKFTNREWHFQADDIANNCNIEKVRLLNDFTAMAYSLTRIDNDSFITLKSGEAVSEAPLLVAGPGTGFGSCLLIPHKGTWFTIACEGGHSLFAPRTDMEQQIFAVLSETNKNVSVERICGGGNLPELCHAMAVVHGIEYQPLVPQEIIEKAMAGDAFCHDLCQIRADAIITSLANMALIGGTRGGIVLASGVSRHLVNFLSKPETIARFADVWPQGDFLQNIPIRLLVNPMAPLVGAAAHYLQDEVWNDSR